MDRFLLYTDVTHGYFKGVSLDGFLRAPAYIVSREADWISLSGSTKGHLRWGDWRLGRVFMVAVNEVWRQQDRDDKGEQQRCGNNGLTHVVTERLCRRTLHTDVIFQNSSCQFRFLWSDRTQRAVDTVFHMIDDNSPSISSFSQKHLSE